jgi:hypothetical protein
MVLTIAEGVKGGSVYFSMASAGREEEDLRAEWASFDVFILFPRSDGLLCS